MKNVLFATLLFMTSISSAGELCLNLFGHSRETTSIARSEEEFVGTLALEEKRLLADYLQRPTALDGVNAYLDKFVSPLKKNLTVFKSSNEVPDSTLIRVAQWRDLFRKAPLLPESLPLLYHQAWMSKSQALGLLKAKIVFTSQYLPSTPHILKVAKMSNVKLDAWQVLFTMEMDSPVRAVPARKEFDEYILDRGLRLEVLEAQALPELQIVMLRFAVEKIK